MCKERLGAIMCTDGSTDMRVCGVCDYKRLAAIAADKDPTPARVMTDLRGVSKADGNYLFTEPFALKTSGKRHFCSRSLLISFSPFHQT
jgi:hypothetical protein